MDTLSLYCEVPVSAFRPQWAREYQETYPVPPPSTVYGMLLSLAGVPWQQKSRYAGVRLALALVGEPETHRVFRKFRRVSQSGDPDPLAHRRPDYQDLLLWLKLWVWLTDGDADQSLIGAVTRALGPDRCGNRRYGGLSLGESSHLVDYLAVRQPDGPARYLRRAEDGPLYLPVWVVHQRDPDGETVLEHFELSDESPAAVPEASSPCWAKIGP